MPQIRSLADLAMRKLTAEERRKVQPLVMNMSHELQIAYLANGSRRLTAFLRRAFWAMRFIPELAAVRMRRVISRYNNMLRWEMEDRPSNPRYGPGFGDFDLRSFIPNRQVGF